MTKASYYFGEYSNLDFALQTLNYDADEPWRANSYITSPRTVVVDRTIENMQFSLKYSYDNPQQDLYSPKVHLYRNIDRLETTDTAGRVMDRVRARKITTLGLTADNQTKIKYGNMEHIISYGLEFYTDNQVGEDSTKDDGKRPSVPDADSTNFGLYLQNEMKFGQYLIIPALRFDSFDSEDSNGNKQDDSNVSPKISLSYLSKDNLLVFLSLSRGFRPPNFSELYPTGQHFPSNDFVLTSDLKPEIVANTELGLGKKYKGVLSKGDNLEFKGSIFQKRGKNFIGSMVTPTERDRTSGDIITRGTTESINIPNTIIKGFEIDASYNSKSFSFKGSLSYVNAKNKDKDEYLDLNNVPLTLTTQFNYKLDDEHSFALNSRYAGESDRVSAANSDEITAGYGIHSLYYDWKYDKNLNVSLGITNIFDKAYQKRFSSVTEEGRSLILSTSYKW